VPCHETGLRPPRTAGAAAWFLSQPGTCRSASGPKGDSPLCAAITVIGCPGDRSQKATLVPGAYEAANGRMRRGCSSAPEVPIRVACPRWSPSSPMIDGSTKDHWIPRVSGNSASAEQRIPGADKPIPIDDWQPQLYRWAIVQECCAQTQLEMCGMNVRTCRMRAACPGSF
jgi:hypothetical protein